MPSTMPLTLGFHDVTAPVVALNEKARFRVYWPRSARLPA